ncbi:hypothetical protein EGI22_12740 [Lacihabitans sp. LS3-19]|uniref:3-coathanger stack domain-containing protein n=1 Tax=Lacihabitans sp. LS3-19 TaxID=2487335 RepID=UPI0020CFDCC5|nr:3-coathanger stack domain-containing protein [Lacihabitans sp. LS3-19]MCP9768786.1 hypothetical protein [Lacihabitans sp. LS3-19]
MKKLFFLVLLLPYTFVFAQNINKLEYFIDADPGFGAGIDVPITANTSLTANINISVSSVSDGFHFLSIRAKDVNNTWGITAIRPFYKEAISTAAIPNITELEYFIDADPGYGLATSVAVTAGSPLTQNFTVTLPNTVSEGFHFLSIRAKDANNKWSEVAVRPFYKEAISTASIPNITAMEYFIDADPGYGLATSVAVTAGSPLTQNFTVALLNTVADGFHFISIRAKDANNKWSAVAVRPFYKEAISTASIPNITALEYFIDADPGYGLATSVAVTAGSPMSQNFTFALPNTVTDGFHFLSVRAKDANNKWSVVAVRPFYKESTVSSSIPNIVAMEYFIDTDPGYGAATAVAVSPDSPVTVNFTAALTSLGLGTHKISIRAKDINNKWSVVGIKDFIVSNTFTLSSSPSAFCQNTAFNIPFTAVGTFNSGNVFTAQLSNASGTFTSGTTSLGSLTSVSSGTIVATVPNSVSVGSNYKIRIISSNPSASDNPAVPFSVLSVCPPPCATSMTLASTAHDISSGILIKEVNASTGVIIATNKITGTAIVTYKAGKSITLEPGFKADNGVVFMTEFGGCN